MTNLRTYFALFCICILLGCTDQKSKNDVGEKFENVRVYQPARALTSFELEHINGPFTEQALLGKWNILFLGYTYCPDICPATMLNLARIEPALSQLNLPYQVVLVSADPQRDSVSKLDDYAQFFNPNFVGVTAEHKTLLPFTRQLGLVYSMVEGKEGQDYLVNHSASLVIINPKGQITAMVKPDFNMSPPSINFEQLPEVIKALSLTI
ncbi:SCO family protein [Catenovulum sp. SM1970]|uniref:SCO family protein n=1 Tax=Marinifaba aquimaris TaxID=2741323 RepID=UPI0015731B6A|nr:SCO family protein [Marinifaba aquimaris]NTS76519.1 SCO family protein [Marinifaba aquimaris]